MGMPNQDLGATTNVGVDKEFVRGIMATLREFAGDFEDTFEVDDHLTPGGDVPASSRSTPTASELSTIQKLDLDESDTQFLVRRFLQLARELKARKAWHGHIGDFLTTGEVADLAGWSSRQAVHKAYKEARLLRLTGSNGEHRYSAITFTDSRPAKPLAGIQQVLRVWSGTDPDGWSTASWLATQQPDLDGRTPRQALIEGDYPDVVRSARQAVAAMTA